MSNLLAFSFNFVIFSRLENEHLETFDQSAVYVCTCIF